MAKRNGISILCGVTNSCLTNLTVSLVMTVFGSTAYEKFSFLFEARETGSGDWIAFMPILFLIIIEKALVEIILIALSLTIEKANIKDECKEKKQ